MKISLIITAFNAEKYLSKAIESFLDQDYQDKELLIIDDISTDKTHEIIIFYTQKFPNLIKWVKEKDSGISNARNIALNYVSGDLIGFLGADDFLHKDFYKKMQYYIKLNPNFDVVYFNNYAVGAVSAFSLSSSISITKRNLIKHCPVASGESFYYRREIFEKIKFNEKNRYSMDYEFNIALVSTKKQNGEKYKFFPVNISAVFNYHSGENISSLNSLKQRLETVAVQLKYSRSLVEKLRVIWRAKKLISKNYSEFLKILRGL